MPKSVAELMSGKSSEKSVDGGGRTFTATRTWRIVMNQADESYSVPDAVGVQVGDPHPTEGIPCVSLSVKADGDSRIVRLVTATYRASPGSGGSGGEDPNLQPPDIRPSQYTVSGSLIEVPVTKWTMIRDSAGADAVQGPMDPLNPAKDRYEGITTLVPLINIAIEQFESSPTSVLANIGKINEDDFTFDSLTIGKYTCMMRAVNCRPTVEWFGTTVYRGFMVTFEFAVSPVAGWWKDVILEGHNIINTNLDGPDVYNKGLNLQHVNGYVADPIALAEGTAGDKMRAVVPIAAMDEKKWLQRPSASPVALNLDGSPRDVQTADPPVLQERYISQEAIVFGDNFEDVGVRYWEVQ